MSLKELINERNKVLTELNAYKELKLSFKKIKGYRMDKNPDEILKVYTADDNPHDDDLTESLVQNKIQQLTDDLSRIYRQINNY